MLLRAAATSRFSAVDKFLLGYRQEDLKPRKSIKGRVLYSNAAWRREEVRAIRSAPCGHTLAQVSKFAVEAVAIGLGVQEGVDLTEDITRAGEEIVTVAKHAWSRHDGWTQSIRYRVVPSSVHHAKTPTPQKRFCCLNILTGGLSRPVASYWERNITGEGAPNMYADVLASDFYRRGGSRFPLAVVCARLGPPTGLDARCCMVETACGRQPCQFRHGGPIGGLSAGVPITAGLPDRHDGRPSLRWAIAARWRNNCWGPEWLRAHNKPIAQISYRCAADGNCSAVYLARGTPIAAARSYHLRRHITSTAARHSNLQRPQ